MTRAIDVSHHNTVHDWHAVKAAGYDAAFIRASHGATADRRFAEIVMTCNVREWRLVLRLRTAKAARPQMREVMVPLVEELAGRYPVLFGGLS